VADLESALGHVFDDPELLTLALTHRSATGPGDESNERLEFLGDAVLGLVVTTHLYETWDMDEGDLSQMRAAVVSRPSLVQVADRIGLASHLRLDADVERTGGRRRPSILADAVEAVLGAVYLDGGLEAAAGVIDRHWTAMIAAAASDPGRGDHKTRLQEVLATRGQVPVYEVEGSGPDHDRRFDAAVYVVTDPGPGVARMVSGAVREAGPTGSGEGPSKKRAERAAARDALVRLGALDA
jgi:ribonuclease-3